MDIVFDDLLYKDVTNKNTQELFKSINEILSKILFYKTKSQVRLGIGPRQYAGARIQVMKINNNNTDTQLYPSIFNMSSGEMVLTSMFCELLKQSDRLGKNFTTIEGIVLVDEVDKHLHIKLQKEVLPTLFNLFPKIQFIVSSHSPFFNFGLKNSNNKFKVFDLDNNGVQCLPLNNDLFNEVYEMFISENEQFAKLYKSLKKDLELSNIPLVITEGKTDWKHIQAAIKALNYKELKFEFLKYEDTMGDARLYQLLESAVKLNTKRKIIGIFDRDNQEILNKINTENNNYKQLGTNVFALIIPLVNKKIYGDQISIEHYYKKEELLKENNEKRRLFLGSEFYNSGMSKKNNYITKTKNIENKVRVNGIIDDKVYLMSDREQINSVAMTKNDFADLILTEDEFAKDFDFSKFKKLLDEIKNICDL